MAKKNPKNKNKLFLSFISFFLLLFALSLIFFQISKKPKEVKAIAGQLNINAVSGGVQNFNQVGIGGDVTGSSAKLYVNGNVGIGTTTPSTRLNVLQTANDGTDGIRTTAANPGGNFTLYHGGDGTGRLRVGTVDTMVLTNTGNVGIGTTGPQAKLHVIGDIKAQGKIHPKGEGTGEYIINGQDAGLGDWGLGFYTSFQNRMYINNNGNVGIGTTGPSQKLTIAGTGAVFGVDNTAIFQAKNSAGTYETYLWPRWSDNIMYLNYGSGGFNIRNNSSVSTMFMTAGGNVGIGTTRPGYKLHVMGDIYANGGWLRTSGSAGWYSESYGGGWYMSDTSWIRTYNSKSVWTDTGLLGSNGGLTIGYGGTSPPFGGAIIAGNVGIGTTIPQSKLSIGTPGDSYYAVYVNTGSGGGVSGYGIYTGVSGSGTSTGVYGSGNTGVYGSGDTGVYGYGTSTGVSGSGNTGVSGYGAIYDFYAGNSYGKSYFAGKVGIGTTTFASQTRLKVTSPGGAVYEDWPSNWGGGIATWDIVAASLYVTGISARSDFSLKKNIQSINYDVLDRVLRLNPVSFYWKDERIDREKHFGFIAQEVEKIFPELVRKDSKGKKSLNYNELIPFLTKSIQEQQLQITSLNKALASQSARLSLLEKDLNLTSTGDLKIIEQNSKFEIRNSKNDLVTKIAAFAEIIVGKIKAGLIETKKLVVDGVDIAKKISDLEQKLEKQEQIIRNQQKEIEALKEIVEKLKK
jgi:hypothetical protein